MTDYTLPDFNDPCAVYAKLQAAHYRLVTGGAAQSIRYTSGGGQTEETTFHKADLTKLESLMAKAKAECEAISDGKPKRFAVAAGGRRSPRNV